MQGREPAGAALSNEIAERIREAYLAVEGTPVKFLPSERALSDEMKVARTTIRKALALLANEGLIRAEHGRGYRTLPRAAGQHQTGRLAIIQPPVAPDSGRGGISESLVVALQRAVLAKGGQALFIDATQQTPDALVSSLREAGVWGAALTVDDEKVFRALVEAGVPCAAVDCPAGDLPLDYIAQDNYGGARLAAEHLIAKGHRDIAWFGAVAVSEHSLSRFAGAQSAFWRNGLKLRKKRIVNVTANLDEEARKLLSSDRPDAVLALWLGYGLAIAHAAAELGLVIGKDLDLVTWTHEENYRSRLQREFGEDGTPPTIVWSTDEMAAITVERLLWHLREPGLKPLRISVPTRLICPT